MECTAACRNTLLLALILLARCLSAAAEDASADVVETLPLGGELEWNLETDIGTMHFYAANELWAVDMMRGGERMADAIALPGIEDPRDVWHIPRTSLLLVTRAQGCGAHERGGVSGSDGPISCAVDLFDGNVLWRHGALPTPDRIYYFPADRIVVLRTIPGSWDDTPESGREASRFTAVQLESGAVLWHGEHVAQTARVNGPYLELLGARTMALNVRDGKPVAAVDVPLGTGYLFTSFPSQHKVLTWKKKQLALYAIPDLAGEPEPESSEPRDLGARKIWEATTQKSLGKISDKLNLHTGPALLPNQRLLVNCLSSVEVLDAGSGKSLWQRKKKMISMGQAFSISPSGAYGVEMAGKSLVIVDLETGSNYAEMDIPGESALSTPDPRFTWRSDQELLLVLHDAGRHPKSVSRVNVPGKSIDWTTELPAPASFRMTSREKGKAAGRIFLALALTTASMANPVVTGDTASYYIFVPNLGVKVAPPTASLPGAQSAGTEQAEVPNARLAMQRYVERADMISETLGKAGLFVSGKDDRYEINRFDMTTGRMSRVAQYAAPDVNGIEPDIVYGLAVSLEQNNSVIRVLKAGSTFHADDPR